MTKRGIVCPKFVLWLVCECRKVIQRKQKLIDVLRKELRDQIQSTFEVVVHLVLEYYKCNVKEDSVTESFLHLFSIPQENFSDDESWL